MSPDLERSRWKEVEGDLYRGRERGRHCGKNKKCRRVGWKVEEGNRERWRPENGDGHSEREEEAEEVTERKKEKGDADTKRRKSDEGTHRRLFPPRRPHLHKT